MAGGIPIVIAMITTGTAIADNPTAPMRPVEELRLAILPPKLLGIYAILESRVLPL
jgi:hypothetical protein